MTTETQALEGRFIEDAAYCALEFAVLYNGANMFRGSLDDVEATLTAGPNTPSLEGTAKVDSISIREPAELRAHVLGAEFLDAENHPEVRFRSTSVELGDDGAARVDGELTIAGTTREVSAEGIWRGPVKGSGSLTHVAIAFGTSIDRREFGLEWQMDLPGGGEALAWEVDLDVHLVLVQHPVSWDSQRPADGPASAA